MTAPQHMVALQRADTTRLSRRDLKRALKAKEVLCAEVLLSDIPDWLERMHLEDLIHCIPRFPSREYYRLMAISRTNYTAEIGGLTLRKRKELAELLAEWECRPVERRRARGRSDSTHRAKRRRVPA